MRRLFSNRGATVAAIGAVAIVAAGGGFAVASGGTISACVSKRTHVFYGGRCHRGDSKLSWNQRGPQGPRGVQGIQGRQGVQGNRGPGSSEVAGYLNANCTSQSTTTAFTTATNGTTGCKLFFPKATFTNTPVLLISPIGTETIAGINESFNSTLQEWEADYTLSGASEIINFEAIQPS